VSAPRVIAIDGPSASGKGTLAKRLAAHFGLPHLDTGLLYRAVGWMAEQSGRPPAEIAAALEASDLANPELRTDHAGQAGSRVAAIPEVRELNIGHFLVGEAIFVGLEQAIREMRRVMDAARAAGAAA